MVQLQVASAQVVWDEGYTSKTISSCTCLVPWHAAPWTLLSVMSHPLRLSTWFRYISKMGSNTDIVKATLRGPGGSCKTFLRSSLGNHTVTILPQFTNKERMQELGQIEGLGPHKDRVIVRWGSWGWKERSLETNYHPPLSFWNGMSCCPGYSCTSLGS